MALKLTDVNSFIKDKERVKKRGKNLKKLRKIVALLIQQKQLPEKNRNHKLKGNYGGYWE